MDHVSTVNHAGGPPMRIQVGGNAETVHVVDPQRTQDVYATPLIANEYHRPK